MSYNMNENRPKNIGLAGVLRRAVRKITINEKNLLVQDNSNKKNHDENNNHNNNHSNSNSDSHGAENFNNSNTQNNLVKNLLKTHANLSHDGVHLPYHTLSGYHVKPYPDDEEDNKNPLSITYPLFVISMIAMIAMIIRKILQTMTEKFHWDILKDYLPICRKNISLKV
jgi:hypothetical protein